MAYRATKTEHTGAKHGRGAYWGPKREAKKESNKLRRRQWKHALLRDHRSSLQYTYARRSAPSYLGQRQEGPT
jgi:hypothetical protein